MLNTLGCACSFGFLASKSSLQHVRSSQQVFLYVVQSLQMYCILSAIYYFSLFKLGDPLLLQNTFILSEVYINKIIIHSWLSGPHTSCLFSLLLWNKIALCFKNKTWRKLCQSLGLFEMAKVVGKMLFREEGSYFPG